ncbi:MAG: ABC transporter substrate-binding protein [Methylococcaceae bacterium]
MRLIFILMLIFSSMTQAEDSIPTFKIGVLPFGTLNWEIRILHTEKLDEQYRVRVETVPVAHSEAGKIALLGSRVDIIVSDWMWVAAQREQNRAMQFQPYSTAQGALMVPADSPIKQLSDLAHRKLGVAGGALDKNWLLLKALVRNKTGQELDRITTPVFAAPPLLNQQITQGRLDAVLNYWNFAAKLEAQGYKTLIDGATVLEQLGFPPTLPSLGYVFNETLAQRDTQGLNRLFAALRAARNRICEHNEDWQTVAALNEETDPAIQSQIRARYCAGRVLHFDENDQKEAARLYALLHRLSTDPLTGRSEELPTGVFWKE